VLHANVIFWMPSSSFLAQVNIVWIQRLICSTCTTTTPAASGSSNWDRPAGGSRDTPDVQRRPLTPEESQTERLKELQRVLLWTRLTLMMSWSWTSALRLDSSGVVLCWFDAEAAWDCWIIYDAAEHRCVCRCDDECPRCCVVQIWSLAVLNTRLRVSLSVSLYRDRTLG